MRQGGYPCPLGAETGPQTIIVRQVVAEQEAQKVLDIHVEVPPNKPAIEQIIDVFVKNLRINSVDVITDKVIVRGEFEAKAVYVADLPNNPVHAIEIKHYRWTQHIDMPGVRRGMDADASVIVQFVDYDVAEYTRAYKYKYEDMTSSNYKNSGYSDGCDDECEDTSDDTCDEECNQTSAASEKHNPEQCTAGEQEQPQPPCNCHHHHHHHACREFDISIVLTIVGKVMTNREVQIGGASTEPMPTMPKG